MQRRPRLLPSRTGIYFVLALGMFPRPGYLRVWDKLTAGLAGAPCLPKPSGCWARQPARLRRSGYLLAPVAEPGDHVDASAERGDVGAHDVDAGDLAVFDLGDAGLGHA
ncbi:MAG: transposase domain-containing protein, partial [Streptosporangiaceae bacterium]